ncbi:hypothetical protein BB559_004953 [Furculomyces boomerangus]|uniref:ATPase AAA-type core domain-containing protein n=1 Tax=Furculomyces boomerangus TaxID=61424 RepID=A0A2T9YBP9_9FUNG|nr:hypothetical protein BB559_004953 [Furculomyces boomerangus]
MDIEKLASFVAKRTLGYSLGDMLKLLKGVISQVIFSEEEDTQNIETLLEMFEYLGESELYIRRLFKSANNSCLLIENLDAISANRKSEASNSVETRVLSSLLNELDGISIKKNIIVIATTNKIENVDDALKRSGRFDKLVSLDMPLEEDRKDICLLLARKIPINPNINFDQIASMTNGYSGAKLVLLYREACYEAIRESKRNKLGNFHFTLWNKLLQSLPLYW